LTRDFSPAPSHSHECRNTRWTATHGNAAAKQRKLLQWNRRQKPDSAVADVLNFPVDRLRLFLGYLQLEKFLYLEVSAVSESLESSALVVGYWLHRNMFILSEGL